MFLTCEKRIWNCPFQRKYGKELPLSSNINMLFLVTILHIFRMELVGRNCLRGSDCKYRESLDKLKKSKILITCQKNTFGELSSKMLLKPSGILLFSRNSEKTVLLN